VAFALLNVKSARTYINI